MFVKFIVCFFFILVLDTSAFGQLNVFYPEKALFENSPSPLTSKTWLITLPSSCWKFPCKLAMLDQENNLYLFAGIWMDIIGRGYMLVTSGN